jgi:hypothetical protein
MEKLEVLIQLVRDQTAEMVLGELKEYASEVDVEFVRRSVSFKLCYLTFFCGEFDVLSGI